MGEQSHLEAMREAVKGDLERARARRPSIFERPAPPPVEIRDTRPPAPDPPSNTVLQGRTGPESAVELVPEPEAVGEAAMVDESMVDEPDPVAEAEPEPESEPAVVADEPPRTGFLRRLAFWR